MYTPFAKGLIALYRFFHPKWRLKGSAGAAGPCVYVVHHQDLYGPIHALGLLEKEARIWALYPFFTRGDCYTHFCHYTFCRRFGLPFILAAPIAGLLALVLSPLLRSLGAIPVYRDGRAVRTLRQSQQALLRGDSLIICPDRDYTSEEEQMGEVYMGFLNLEKMYRKKSGKHLPFVPLHIDGDGHTLELLPPVLFREGQDFRPESRRVAATLRSGINQRTKQHPAADMPLPFEQTILGG